MLYSLATWKSSAPPLGELSPVEILMLAPGDRVTRLEVENMKTKEKVILRREEAGWFLESPVNYPAEDLLVRGMVAAVTHAHRLRRFPFHRTLPKELGLNPPQIRIAIETQKEPRRQVLLLGAGSPIGGMGYARWEREKEYFLTPPEFKAVFERTAYSLRRKKLFRVPWDEVTRMEYRTPKKLYRLEKNGRVWRGFLGEEAKEIPLEKVDHLIYAFQSLYVKDFLDGKDPANHELGLVKGRSDFRLEGKGGLLEKLTVGSQAKGRDALYALREKENLVLEVAQPNLTALEAQWETLFMGWGKIPDDARKLGTSPGENPKGLPQGAQAVL